MGLKERAISGVRWNGLSMALTTAIHLVTLAVLGRLLPPSDFGLMGMIMVVIAFAKIFADMGVSSAIIHRQDVTQDALSSLYWLNIVVGIAVFSLISTCAPLLAAFFQEPRLANLFCLASLVFVIGPFGQQFQILLQKGLHFRTLTRVDIASASATSFVAIVLAIRGYGVWSLIWGSLAGALFRTALLLSIGHRNRWLPKFRFKWCDTQGFLSFGMFRMGAMVANQINSRMDQLVIGAVMGPTALGYYYMAFRLAMEPILKLNPIITSVAFPVFSSIQTDTSRLKRGFMKMIRFMASVNAPILLGLAAVAPLAVPFLVGNKWAPSVILVQILVFCTLIRSVVNAGASVILAMGKANWTFYWNSALTLVIPVVLYLASVKGQLVYIPMALVFTQSILFFFHYVVFIRRLLGPCLFEYLGAFVKPTIIALSMAISLQGISMVLPVMPAAIQLVIYVTAGVLIYIGLSCLFQTKLLRDLSGLLPGFLRWPRVPNYFASRSLKESEGRLCK
jgi:O-antigen/teichoic acid export membrane protein